MEEIKLKQIQIKCEHSKRKSRCEICGGSEICIHKKVKSSCTECNKKMMCIHNRRKNICVDCCGSSICEHFRQKYICIDCCGSQICIHKKRISRCLQCGGSEICIHKIIKSGCKECNQNSMCIHNKVKYRCFKCNGTQICEHNKIRGICVDCGGSQICPHKKKKSYCVDCNGSQICIHYKIKSYCVECKGNKICNHNKIKTRCSECCGIDLCKNCKIVRASKKYDNHCMRCFIYLFPDQPVCRNYKTKESATSQFITNNFPNFTWTLDKKVEDGCSRRRPDLMCDLGYQIIIVEVDENQHTDYDCSCENKRLMEISQDLGHRPIIFIRFNPDDYINSNGEKITSCWGSTPKTGILKIKNNKNDEWDERLKVLKSQIEYWSNPENKTEKTIEVIQLFYNQNS